uniref:Uncharacterized protein n=1 Tax=Wuchereria bancrofti TaxID=6293 RepID=A0AAF5Q120_WUCBA
MIILKNLKGHFNHCNICHNLFFQILGLYFGSIRMGMNAFKPRSLADFMCCIAFRVSSKVKHLVTVFGTSSCLLWLLKFMNE